MIDHAIIDPNHTREHMLTGIETAKRYQTGVFVTQPFRVREARKPLDGTGRSTPRRCLARP